MIHPALCQDGRERGVCRHEAAEASQTQQGPQPEPELRARWTTPALFSQGIHTLPSGIKVFPLAAVFVAEAPFKPAKPLPVGTCQLKYFSRI